MKIQYLTSHGDTEAPYSTWYQDCAGSREVTKFEKQRLKINMGESFQVPEWVESCVEDSSLIDAW